MVTPTSVSREVLVAILNNVRDFEIARDSHWYRIPLGSVEKWLTRSWPPRWLAFYQTKVFRRKSHAVTYFAEVHEVRQVRRGQLFPDQPQDRRLPPRSTVWAAWTTTALCRAALSYLMKAVGTRRACSTMISESEMLGLPLAG